MKLSNIKKYSKKFATTALVALIASSVFLPQGVEAANSKWQFWGISFDAQAKRIDGAFFLDDNGRPDERLYYLVDDYNPINFSNSEYVANYDDVTGQQTVPISNASTTHGQNKSVYPYTWPGIKGVSATSEDLNYAKWVSQELIEGLNSAARLVSKSSVGGNCGKPNSSYYLSLTQAMANSIPESGKQSSTYGTCSWNMTAGTDAILEDNNFDTDLFTDQNSYYYGVKASDFSLISIDHGNLNGAPSSMLVLTRLPKGYADGQYLEFVNPIANKAMGENKGTVTHVDWSYIVYAAQQTYANQVSYETFAPSNLIFDLMIGFGDTIVTGAVGMAGLKDLETLMINQNTSYYMGVMPETWFVSASNLSVIFEILSLGVIAFAILSLLTKRSLSTFNPVMRVQLMDGIMKLVMVAILLIIFPVFFYLLLRFNQLLVNLMASTAPIGASFNTSITGNPLVHFVVQFIFIFILVKINIMYLMRAITVSLLYAIAPLIISTISLGEKYKDLLPTFIKELVSNIFLQSFHALILVFFLSTFSTSARLSAIETVGVYMAFIPLTEFFKNTLFGLRSGTDEMVKTAASGVGNGVAVGIGGLGMGLTKFMQPNKATGSEKIMQETNLSGDTANIKSGKPASTNNEDKRGEVGYHPSGNASKVEKAKQKSLAIAGRRMAAGALTTAAGMGAGMGASVTNSKSHLTDMAVASGVHGIWDSGRDAISEFNDFDSICDRGQPADFTYKNEGELLDKTGLVGVSMHDDGDSQSMLMEYAAGSEIDHFSTPDNINAYQQSMGEIEGVSIINTPPMNGVNGCIKVSGISNNSKLLKTDIGGGKQHFSKTTYVKGNGNKFSPENYLPTIKNISNKNK